MVNYPKSKEHRGPRTAAARLAIYRPGSWVIHSDPSKLAIDQQLCCSRLSVSQESRASARLIYGKRVKARVWYSTDVRKPSCICWNGVPPAIEVTQPASPAASGCLPSSIR